jgi:CP family cyanate transporter-like MFS transporter
LSIPSAGLWRAGSANAYNKINLMANSGAHQEQELVSLDSEGMPPYQRRYRWVMLVLIWSLYFVFGIVGFSIAPLVTPIIEDLNISYSQMGIILGAWPLTYTMVAAIGGAVIDRLGIRKSIFIGVIFITLSVVLRYFASGFITMFLCVALFGLGGPMISIGAPKTISLWFLGKERGTAVGVYMTAVLIGQATILSVMNSVVMPLTGYSWRLAFVCFGLLAFTVALLWLCLARDVKSAETTEGISSIKVFRRIISIRNVQLVITMGLFSFAVGHGFNNWLPKILEVGGLSPSIAGFAASIPVWVGVPTLIFVPRIIAPHSRGYCLALLSVGVIIALLIIALTSGVPLIVGLVIYGISNCCILPLLVLILMDLPEIGSRYMGSAAGLYFCISELGGFLGPFIVGAIKDLSGGFLAAAGVLAGLSLIRAIIALSLKIKPADEFEAPS